MSERSEASELKSFVLDALAYLGAVVRRATDWSGCRRPGRSALPRSPRPLRVDVEPDRGENLRPNSSFWELLSREVSSLSQHDAGGGMLPGSRFPDRMDLDCPRGSGLEMATGPGRRSKKSGKEMFLLFTFRVTSCRTRSARAFISSWFRRRMVRHGRSIGHLPARS